MRLLLAALVAALLVPGPTAAAATAAAPPPGAQVRVDQIGYATTAGKDAYLMLPTRPTAAVRFTVLDARGHVVLRGRTGRDLGRWNASYPAVLALDLTALRRPGRYRIDVPAAHARSVPFLVAPARTLADPLLDDTAAYFAAQRDGADVRPGALHRRPSHLNDAHARVYAHPHFTGPDTDQIADRSLTPTGAVVDVEGGWFDAGDFVKFTHTTSYATTLLGIAARDRSHARTALGGEFRHGLRWLGRAWDPRHDRLAFQVGIGSGNRAGTFAGDHDLWRLPEKDDHLTGSTNRYLRHRPVFATSGAPGKLAPNQAGRLAAAFAVAAQLDARTGHRAGDHARALAEYRRAADAFRRARTTHVRPADVVTALPHAFYPEAVWRDDLALGAAELAAAARQLHRPVAARAWEKTAVRWAAAYRRLDGPGDTLNLYDVGALADREILRLAARDPGGPAARDRAALLAGMRAQLGVAAQRAVGDPFRAGVTIDDFDAVSHAFGVAATATYYRELTGDRRYDALGHRASAWAFGANPWGVSMMIGTGTTFPRCPQHVVANLSGGRDGTPPVLRGAVVNGPNDTGLFEGGLGSFFDTAHRCPDPRGDRYRAFTGHGSRFVDDVRSWQTVEPANDFTATAVLALAA